MKSDNGEDSTLISGAAERLTPLGGPVKSKTFDKSSALLVQNVTSVSSILSSFSEDEENCIHSSISSNSSSESSSIRTSSISSGSSSFEYLPHLGLGIYFGNCKESSRSSSTVYRK
jgi:hypothetical protein